MSSCGWMTFSKIIFIRATNQDGGERRRRPARVCPRTGDSVMERLSRSDYLPRVQADRRGGPAAGAVPLGERRGVPRLPVDLHDDRGVGVGSEGRGVGGPLGPAVGQGVTPPEPRGQTAGVAS